MKIKDLRKMIRGLKGDMDCEFKIDYDCGCAEAGCEDMKMSLEKGYKNGKIVTVAIFRG